MLVSLLRRPLPGCMQHTEHAYLAVGQVVNQNVILVHYQLASVGDATSTPKTGMIDQAAGLLCEQLIKGQCGSRIVGLNVMIYRFAVLGSFKRPVQFDHFDVSSRRRVAARLAANLASTSAAGIRLPALAESMPIC